MQFLYHQDAKNLELLIENEAFLHLKARRVKVGQELFLRNLKDEFLYGYEIIEIGRNFCKLHLKSYSQTYEQKYPFSIALAVIDTKILEKTLPFLNELGVGKLILVYAEFSQKNFKLDLKRYERILINSCEQCGRTHLMEFEIFKDIKSFCQKYQNVILLDFEGQNLQEIKEPKEKIFFIGPEGGFSQAERRCFTQKVRLECQNILKSQTALIALSAKILI
ncbi:16S rRNA (uracil(1498)-N(3))-methyltransferase [Campylobacter jejuni]|nr:16S rRNA (uracil(1498)-N(3))-methyltransferase [Campylobacter jejuni]